MARILEFIVNYMSFLWEEARFRIAGSEVTVTSSGDAWLIVESSHLRLRFISDRAQLLLDLQPRETAAPSEWFSIDLIRRMILGRPEESGVLDASYAEFIKERLGRIEEMFSSDSWPETRAQLKKLMVKRSKEMFG